MKPTWQSSTFSSLGTSDKAVDGHYTFNGLHTSRNYHDGQCAISGLNQPSVIWRVNLGKIYRIDHINLYFRTENLKWGEYNLIKLAYIVQYTNLTVKNNLMNKNK